jgi:hypothetical protein
MMRSVPGGAVKGKGNPKSEGRKKAETRNQLNLEEEPRT